MLCNYMRERALTYCFILLYGGVHKGTACATYKYHRITLLDPLPKSVCRQQQCTKVERSISPTVKSVCQNKWRQLQMGSATFWVTGSISNWQTAGKRHSQTNVVRTRQKPSLMWHRHKGNTTKPCSAYSQGNTNMKTAPGLGGEIQAGLPGWRLLAT